ncbi:MAG: hypothetical protein EAZ91_04890 [Cytophagales bacterium]|nr:MAG: hypothetical protein EAZ91_04890 [Cytophagales bacterium]
MQLTIPTAERFKSLKNTIAGFFNVEETLAGVDSREFWANELLHIRKTYINTFPSSFLITWLICFSPLMEGAERTSSIFYLFRDRPIVFFFGLLAFTYSSDLLKRTSYWFVRWVMEKHPTFCSIP